MLIISVGYFYTVTVLAQNIVLDDERRVVLNLDADLVEVELVADDVCLDSVVSFDGGAAAVLDCVVVDDWARCVALDVDACSVARDELVLAEHDFAFLRQLDH